MPQTTSVVAVATRVAASESKDLLFCHAERSEAPMYLLARVP
jgi:hypothetical protein